MPSPQTIRSEIEIEASPEHLFSILEDLERYGEWNPFTPSVESSLEIGAAVRMRVRLLKSRFLFPQVEYVTANQRPTRLCWGVNIPFRFMIRADRCQILEPVGDGRTRYISTDTISGWLTPIVMHFFGAAMQRGFDDCALSLKKRAES